jgi:nicotinamide riboside kinase
MLRIAETQIERESSAARCASEYLFCDTSPLTTLFYSHHMFGKASEELVHLADRSYDATVLCLPDFPFVQDGTRQPSSFRALQHQWYLTELHHRNWPYVAVGGDVPNRIERVRKYLAKEWS